MKIKAAWTIITVTVLVAFGAQGVAAQAKRRPTAPVKKAPVGKDGTLSVEAGLVYKSGDVKPVARTTFYLATEPLDSIMDKSGMTRKDEGFGLFSWPDQIMFWKNFQTLYPGAFQRTVAAVKASSVAEVTTDFGGKGTFTPAKAGKYWIIGFGGSGNESVIWSVEVELKGGPQSITLDNQSASAIG